MKYLLLILVLNGTVNSLFAQSVQYYYEKLGLIQAIGYEDDFSTEPIVRRSVYSGTRTIKGQENVLVYTNLLNQNFSLYYYFEEGKMYKYLDNGDRKLIFDHDVSVGDSLVGHYDGYMVTDIYMDTLLNGELRKRYDLNGPINTAWITGIGDITTGLHIDGSFGYFDDPPYLCVSQNVELLWQYSRYDDGICDSTICYEPKLYFDIELTGLSISVSNHSLYAEEYIWDWGDGSVDEGYNPGAHTYETGGCYELTLKAPSNCDNSYITYSRSISSCDKVSWLQKYSSGMVLNTYRYSEHIDYYYRDLDIFTVRDGVEISRSHIWSPTGFTRFIKDIAFIDTLNWIVVCGHYGATPNVKAIFVTHDGGQTWKAKEPSSYFLRSIESTTDGRAWVSRGNTHSFLYYTDDFGDSWQKVYFEDTDLKLFSFDYISDTLLLALGYLGIQPFGSYVVARSYDGGLAWSYNILDFNLFELQFLSDKIGYGFRGSKLYITRDGGYHFTVVNERKKIISMSFDTPAEGVIIDDHGRAYYTSDTASTFDLVSCGLEDVYTASSYEGEYILGERDENGSFIYPLDLEVLLHCELLGVEDIRDPTDIIVYPNPVENRLNIDAFSQGIGWMSVYDIMGNQMIDQSFQNSIDVSNWDSGVYFLELRSIGSGSVNTIRFFVK